mmetsp:Transcript_49688/g.97180  ORF Transcript_49688/g.97180 Transcript_49688/m.97180 type:complete len:253 (+) Transcript_49688:2640-3398(+)
MARLSPHIQEEGASIIFNVILFILIHLLYNHLFPTFRNVILYLSLGDRGGGADPLLGIRRFLSLLKGGRGRVMHVSIVFPPYVFISLSCGTCHSPRSTIFCLSRRPPLFTSSAYLSVFRRLSTYLSFPTSCATTASTVTPISPSFLHPTTVHPTRPHSPTPLSDRQRRRLDNLSDVVFRGPVPWGVSVPSSLWRSPGASPCPCGAAALSLLFVLVAVLMNVGESVHNLLHGIRDLRGGGGGRRRTIARRRSA